MRSPFRDLVANFRGRYIPDAVYFVYVYVIGKIYSSASYFAGGGGVHKYVPVWHAHTIAGRKFAI